jgi:Alpha/beta hydrolase domain
MADTMAKERQANSEVVPDHKGWASRVGGFTCLPLIVIAVTCSSAPAEAHVTKLAITVRAPFAGGQEFGTAGAYEQLKGIAYFEVDPHDPLNAVITDIGKAPRNEDGMVEFSSAFMILKPVNMAHGNRKIFSTVNNRGNDGLLNATSVVSGSFNELLLKQGYTVVDVGWEGDRVPSALVLAANLPRASNGDDSPIVGPMRIEYSDRNLPLAGSFDSTLKGSAAFMSYETADTNTEHSTLTVRDTELGSPKTPIPSDRWAFGSCPTGQASLVPSTSHICYFDRFDATKVYELIYPAKNPIVMGLGHATTRDFTSFLRYSTSESNPLGTGIKRAYATGCSQTGLYLRDFIFYGFNEDEQHRRVFEGIIPTCAGGMRNELNVRFADPDVFSDRDFQHDFMQTAFPPFTYGVVTDPISGITDGILKRPDTDPVVMQLDSESEFWQLMGSLQVRDGLGDPWPRLPWNARLYFQSSTAHGFATGGLLQGPAGRSALCANPTPGGSNFDDTLKALAVDLDEWVDQGIEPPPSNYPGLRHGTLVRPDDFIANYPTIPGIGVPSGPNTYQILNWGPLYDSQGGIMSFQPPVSGPSYEMFVPKSNSDGLNVGGIRPIQARAPLGTTTGWNIRNQAHRPQDSMCSLTGTYAAFATTKAERLLTGDPRPSLEERYENHDGFVEAVTDAVHELVRARFLLMEDGDKYIEAAKASSVLR